MDHHTTKPAKTMKPVTEPAEKAEPVAVDPAVAEKRAAKIAAGLKLEPTDHTAAVVRATPSESGMTSFGSILDFLDFLKPDWSKVNKSDVKAGVGQIINSMKNATTWPGNFDDALLDMLKSAVDKFIDGINQPVPLVVGDAVFTAADVDTYLSGFPNVSDEVRAKLKKRPRTLGLLKSNFTQAEQAKIVGNPFLLGLLSILGPMILEFLKNWLSRN